MNSEELLTKIKSRGHWKFVFRPTPFVERRVETLRELEKVVADCSVMLRGWDFPHISSRDSTIVESNWIGRNCSWSSELEVWRAFPSGQVAVVRALAADWPELDLFAAPSATQQEPSFRTRLSVYEVVYQCMEIFEFAARLAMSKVGSNSMGIAIDLKNIKERALEIRGSRRIPFLEPRVSQSSEWSWNRTYDRTELLQDPALHAHAAASELFYRFGWDPSPQVLRSISDELKR